MPYNTSAIPPTQEVTGTTRLPFSRVKKVIATDLDISIMSNAGAFVITLATEMFIQHLAEQGHQIAKMQRKPRRNIQYRDLATAVSNQDKLEFLADIVPKTVTVRQIREKKATANPIKINGIPVTKPDRTPLDGVNPVQNGVGRNTKSSDMEEDLKEMSAHSNNQIQIESNIQPTSVDTASPGTADAKENITQGAEIQ